ncbi:Type I restriction enzyme, S subunit [Tenacibaculum dicentrarchi]|nr:restriction endonuclease subunit S [Tenacibaculum dicentrarchi]SOS47172.1 Type I restriction enzyme, S subunit [Tenacibaculum dicentrarchi]
MNLENKIPNGWVETTLGEVINIKHGYAFKGEFISLINNNKILITPGNFKVGGGFKSDKFKYYSGDIPDSYILEKGNIIVTMTDLSKIGDTLGFSAKVPNDNRIYLHNQRIGLIQFKNSDFDKEYIYWLLRTNHYQKSMVNSATGSTVRHTSPNRIQEYKFYYPSFQEQVAIAKTLTAFDDKIENLQAQNNTLETTAQTIFKEWFGKYQIGDELPEGWRVGEINDLIEFIIDNRGKTPPLIEKNINSYSLIEVNSITGDDRNVNINLGKKFVNEETYQNWFRKGHPINGDILLSTVGSIGQLAQVFDEKICIAQNIIALRSNTSGNFLYELLKINQKLIINLDISSVQPSIKVPHLLAMPVIIPNIELIKKFDNLVDKLSKKITSNNQQVQTLKKTRDTLLPKLMKGELRVKI